MGDGADDAIDRAFNDEELFYKIKHDRCALFEEGILDDTGKVDFPVAAPVFSKKIKISWSWPMP